MNWSAHDAVAAHRDDGGTGELFGITELCREFGISLRAIRSKAIGTPLAEIKHYLDLYGAHGEGRVQQMRYVLQRTDAAIAELEAKRAHIDATLAELRVINETVRRSLADRR